MLTAHPRLRVKVLSRFGKLFSLPSRVSSKYFDNTLYQRNLNSNYAFRQKRLHLEKYILSYMNRGDPRFGPKYLKRKNVEYNDDTSFFFNELNVGHREIIKLYKSLKAPLDTTTKTSSSNIDNIQEVISQFKSIFENVDDFEQIFNKKCVLPSQRQLIQIDEIINNMNVDIVELMQFAIETRNVELSLIFIPRFISIKQPILIGGIKSLQKSTINTNTDITKKTRDEKAKEEKAPSDFSRVGIYDRFLKYLTICTKLNIYKPKTKHVSESTISLKEMPFIVNYFYHFLRGIFILNNNSGSTNKFSTVLIKKILLNPLYLHPKLSKHLSLNGMDFEDIITNLSVNSRDGYQFNQSNDIIVTEDVKLRQKLTSQFKADNKESLDLSKYSRSFLKSEIAIMKTLTDDKKCLPHINNIDNNIDSLTISNYLYILQHHVALNPSKRVEISNIYNDIHYVAKSVFKAFPTESFLKTTNGIYFLMTYSSALLTFQKDDEDVTFKILEILKYGGNHQHLLTNNLFGFVQQSSLTAFLYMSYCQYLFVSCYQRTYKPTFAMFLYGTSCFLHFFKKISQDRLYKDGVEIKQKRSRNGFIKLNQPKTQKIKLLNSYGPQYTPLHVPLLVVQYDYYCRQDVLSEEILGRSQEKNYFDNPIPSVFIYYAYGYFADWVFSNLLKDLLIIPQSSSPSVQLNPTADSHLFNLLSHPVLSGDRIVQFEKLSIYNLLVYHHIINHCAPKHLINEYRMSRNVLPLLFNMNMAFIDNKSYQENLQDKSMSIQDYIESTTKTSGKCSPFSSSILSVIDKCPRIQLNHGNILLNAKDNKKLAEGHRLYRQDKGDTLNPLYMKELMQMIHIYTNVHGFNNFSKIVSVKNISRLQSFA